MKYILIVLISLSFFACRKKESDSLPPANDSIVIVVPDTPFVPFTRSYVGQYKNREWCDDNSQYLYLDTAFQNTMQVTFVDTANVRCKLYIYTIYHSRVDPFLASPAGRDSLVFTCNIGTNSAFLDTLSPPIRSGVIRFTVDRDSVYFSNFYNKGQGYYWHAASFAGKKQ